MNEVRQDTMNPNSNFGIDQEMLGRNATNNALHQVTRQNRSIQTPFEEGNQNTTMREEAINPNNQHHIQNIHREYSNNERSAASDRQFFAPQEGHMESGRKSKVVQVDHVEEQYVIKRNTFSGKNPLYIEDTERPVFVNNYYVQDNPQQMFREIGETNNAKSKNLSFHLQQVQAKHLKQDKASQSIAD